MTLKGFFTGLANFIGRHWSSIIVAGATGGLVLAHIWPPLEQEKEAFLVVVLSSIGVLLIEIRSRVRPPQYPGVGIVTYRTMREARLLLLNLMTEEICRNEPTEIIIRGGRLRSIVEIIRELNDRLEDCRASEQTRIEIHLLDPEFLRAMTLPGTLNMQAQHARNEVIGAQVVACIQELNKIAGDEGFRRNHVTLDVVYYREIPSMYYFLVGNDNLVFGGFLWDGATSDMEGPRSPCWYMSGAHPAFDSIRSWLRNRAQLGAAEASAATDGVTAEALEGAGSTARQAAPNGV